ncbi:hypothetical protein [Streptomyces fuscichromogenes]|uniref:Uncharacterized protein n=1 Tax=Streptomyces fuscichromogenes TaxID=1324013 RepID=A0A917XPX5_9ACTN|nr:hypothetical protein [Streptomyces fuscichromogenes]GGN45587.1 hypothetical protein GCM10011578_097690 [Streptomyces fuscichromogenes]
MDRRNQLLVIDYPGRRAAGHVSDLELEESGFDCRYAMQDDMPDDLYAGPYAGHLIEASKVDASRVAAVIG